MTNVGRLARVGVVFQQQTLDLDLTVQYPFDDWICIPVQASTTACYFKHGLEQDDQALQVLLLPRRDCERPGAMSTKLHHNQSARAKHATPQNTV